MVSVQACSRLHFGLLNPLGAGDPETLRRFGGVGMMIEHPGLQLQVQPAETWSAEGPLAERALAFAQRFHQATRSEQHDGELPPHRLVIEQASPEHAGLGTGTQLGMAVGRALAVSWSCACDLRTLARRVGRGLRSAIGAYGFEQGGLLVEAGKHSAEELAPLVARWPVPKSWRVVLVFPDADAADTRWHGEREVEAFGRLAARPAAQVQTDALCRLVLLGLLPALVEGDLDTFGEALHEFNRRVGEAFAPAQGGVYASPRIADVVAFARGQGVRGVGQSSWGPTVFAIVSDEDRARHLAAGLRSRFDLKEADVQVTAACNQGARIEIDHSI